jgi:phosphoribosyl-ATP pyrophosphohydrolase
VSKEAVKRFNVVCGNSPSQGSLYDVWKQLKQQAALVKEEALETFDASQEEGIQELIDGWADVWYVNTYLGQLLEAFGVDTKGVKDVVCANNAQKYTTSYTYAKESQEALEEKGTECYIETTVYEGETYYTVRRNEDQKVMKLKHHERPDLSVFVPQEFK